MRHAQSIIFKLSGGAGVERSGSAIPENGGRLFIGGPGDRRCSRGGTGSCYGVDNRDDVVRRSGAWFPVITFFLNTFWQSLAFGNDRSDPIMFLEPSWSYKMSRRDDSTQPSIPFTTVIVVIIVFIFVVIIIFKSN